MDLISTPKVDDVSVARTSYNSPSFDASAAHRCTLNVTPSYLIFRESASSEAETWIPYPLVLSLVLQRPSFHTSTPLVLHTRNFQVFTFLFDKELDAINVWESVKALFQNILDIKSLPAFSKKTLSSIEPDYWNIYDPMKEFARMGITSENPRTNAWRVTHVNRDYEFCPTYPAVMVVPAKLSDATLRYGKDYRSKARIPALVYLHWANLGSITRSSQPMVGLKNARSVQDEKLIEAIFHSHAMHSTGKGIDSHSPVYGATATNLIIDARPTTNAVANSVKGAGTENMDYYRNCKKAYLGVDSIHVMRASLKVILDALTQAELTGYVDRSLLQKSGWLKHISAILDGVLIISRNIHIANSHVLIHCSDGWDRTSQLSSLSQLCLDPYYRTIEGFAILIEKDWLSFGHRFADRSGHVAPGRSVFAEAEGDDSIQGFVSSIFQMSKQNHSLREISPVFHQFLDCTWQIMRQYPNRFEFNHLMLLDLFYHLYSCEYGSFLFNSERERVSGRQGTLSLWNFFLPQEAQVKYRNPTYDPCLDDPNKRNSASTSHTPPDQGVLFPNPRRVRFWSGLFGRTDEELNGVDIDPLLASEVVQHEIVENASSSTLQTVPPPSSTTSPPSPLNDQQDLHSEAWHSITDPRVRTRSNSTGIKTKESENSSSQTNLQEPNSSISSAPFQNAFASVVRFGGSTWNSVSKSYQDAMRDFNAGQMPQASSENERSSGKPTTTSTFYSNTSTVNGNGNLFGNERNAFRNMSLHGDSNGGIMNSSSSNLGTTSAPVVPGMTSSTKRNDLENKHETNPWKEYQHSSPAHLPVSPYLKPSTEPPLDPRIANKNDMEGLASENRDDQTLSSIKQSTLQQTYSDPPSSLSSSPLLHDQQTMTSGQIPKKNSSNIYLDDHSLKSPLQQRANSLGQSTTITSSPSSPSPSPLPSHIPTSLPHVYEAEKKDSNSSTPTKQLDPLGVELV